MKRIKLAYGLFSDVVEDPTDACVDAGLQVFKSAEYDCIIGLGGGSPMDTAKAISFMSVNAGHVRDYKAPTQIDVCGPPVILIPTTGGTGSELTRWCVITDTKIQRNIICQVWLALQLPPLSIGPLRRPNPGGLLQIQPWIVSLTL